LVRAIEIIQGPQHGCGGGELEGGDESGLVVVKLDVTTVDPFGDRGDRGRILRDSSISCTTRLRCGLSSRRITAHTTKVGSARIVSTSGLVRVPSAVSI